MPTLYGYDADNDRSRGEVGKCGCNISSLKDMEIPEETISEIKSIIDEISDRITADKVL